jgi:glutathione S-transferase
MTSNLIVYGGWEAFGVADFSPFCLKLKTYLRMIGVPYTSKLGDPRKAPTKKIPYIDDGGTLVGDSGLIVEYLKKKHGDSLDAALTPDQHALGHVVRRTLEESTYWAGVYVRWVEDAPWPELYALLRPLFPPVIGGLIANTIRSGVSKQAYGQGIARHTPEEVYAIGKADLDAVSAILGQKPYLFGDSPSSYDAVLHGFVGNLMAFPKASPISQHARSHANLVSFVDRMNAKYWATPDAR